jgi:hypothetical protein
MPECDLKCILESFQKNHIVGESLLAFGDEEWEELIPSLGFRFHCRQAISKKIKLVETTILSKMQEKRAPREAIRETMQLSTGLRKFSAFFQQKVLNHVLNLPEDVEPVLLPTESTQPAVQATILSSDNVQKLIF